MLNIFGGSKRIDRRTDPDRRDYGRHEGNNRGRHDYSRFDDNRRYVDEPSYDGRRGKEESKTRTQAMGLKKGDHKEKRRKRRRMRSTRKSFKRQSPKQLPP